MLQAAAAAAGLADNKTVVLIPEAHEVANLAQQTLVAVAAVAGTMVVAELAKEVRESLF